MKFRFLGDRDCPDWLLKEIYTLSRLSYVRMSTIADNVLAHITDSKKLDEDRLKLVAEKANFDFNDVKAIVAALDFILTSAIRNKVSDSDLKSELLQLGLPAEHCKVLCKLYGNQDPKVFESAECLRLNKLKSVEVIPSEEKSPIAKIALKIETLSNEEECTTINIIKDDIPVLLEELKRARSLMESLKE